MTIDPRLHRIVATKTYPLLFATVSGAHVLPLEKVVGLDVLDETAGTGLRVVSTWKA